MKSKLLSLAFIVALVFASGFMFNIARADMVIDENFFSSSIADFNTLTSTSGSWNQYFTIPEILPYYVEGKNFDSNITQLNRWIEGQDWNYATRDFNVSFDLNIFPDYSTGNKGIFRFSMNNKNGGLISIFENGDQIRVYTDANTDSYLFYNSTLSSEYGALMGAIPKQNWIHVQVSWIRDKTKTDGNGYFYWQFSDSTGSELFNFTEATQKINSSGLGILFYSDWYIWNAQRGNLHYSLKNINMISTHEVVPALQGTINEAFDPFTTGIQPAKFWITLTSNLTGANITDANCSGFFDGTTISLPYNSIVANAYGFSSYPTTPKTYDYNYSCTKAGYFDFNGIGQFTGQANFTNYLSVIDIQNSTHRVDFNSVNIFPTTLDYNDTTFSVQNNFVQTLSVPIMAWNSLQNGKQYFVYTSIDGVNWAFNDSLTYGTTNYDPIQKIWIDGNHSYYYGITDSLVAGQKKYYSFRFQPPARYWLQLKDSLDWFQQLNPSNSQVLGLNKDVFSISTFSDMRNIFLIPLPDIVDYSSGVFEFQFTAWADSPQVISIGTRDNNTDNIIDYVVITPSMNRYSIAIPSNTYDSQLLFLTDANASNNLYFMDYALIEKNYFTQRLHLTQINDLELPVGIISGASNAYLQEGLSFKANGAAFDRIGDLNYLKIIAYLDSNLTAAKTYLFNLASSPLNSFSFNYALEPVIDLNGTYNNPLTPRTLFVQAQLFNSAGSMVSEQSQSVKFLQFPSFPSDLSTTLSVLPAQIGDNPNLQLQTKIKSISALLGYKIIIYREGSGKTLSNPDYSETIYNGTDFSCTLQCNLKLKLDQFVFATSGTYNITILTLLNTENENLIDNYAVSTQHIIVNFKNFEIARILEIVERNQAGASEYMNIEPIGLAVQLKTGTGENLQGSMRVQLFISNCADDTNATCIEHTAPFNPTSFAYDPRTHYNYFFFRDYFVNDDGTLLIDGNYYRFKAVLADSKSQFSQDTNVLLTGKCQVYDTSNFFSMVMSSLNYLVYGCTTDQAGIVSTAQNSDREKRILINNATSLSAPTLEATACLNTDSNNQYVDSLKQDLLCVSWYKISDQTIDKFRFTISNNYSDFAVEDETKQYATIEVPFEIIALNDMSLLKSTLEKQFDTEINTIGDTFYYGFNSLFTGAINPLGDYASFAAASYTGSGLITNVGFDINLQRPFDPQYVSGLIFFRVKGLSVVNQNDYKEKYAVLKAQSPLIFREWGKQSGVSLPNDSTTIEIYGSDMTKIASYLTPTGLIIDETPSISVKDANGFVQSLPHKLHFDIITDLFYGNGTNIQSHFVPITISAIINQKALTLAEGLAASAALFMKDPTAWAIKNILIIVIILSILIIAAFVFSRFAQPFVKK